MDESWAVKAFVRKYADQGYAIDDKKNDRLIAVYKVGDFERIDINGKSTQVIPMLLWIEAKKGGPPTVETPFGVGKAELETLFADHGLDLKEVTEQQRKAIEEKAEKRKRSHTETGVDG